MPQYTFKCEKCDETFEITMTISEYTNKQKCPNCKSSKCARNYKAENISGFMSDPQTLGVLAEKNTEERNRREN